MSSLSLKQLSYFVTVAEEQHFHRAAARLHISQPPLTQRIQAMERDLGVRLFKRKGRLVELTEAGRLVLAEARAVLAQVDRVRETARKAEQGLAGTLRVAVVISATFIPTFSEAVEAFKRDYPGVALDLSWTVSSEGIRALRERKVDLCLIRRVSLPLDGLAHVTVARDRLMFVLPANHPHADKEKVAFEDVADDRFILFPAEKRSAIYGRLMDVWAQAGRMPRIAQEAESGLTILALVAAGLGNTILPSTLAGLHMPKVVWKPIDVDDRLTSTSLMILCREETMNERLPSRFISYVQRCSPDVAHEMPAGTLLAQAASPARLDAFD